ncbi:MAG: hypothetical protein L3K03_06825 [Thermoplasmata archaeon]|nr:hypothetical protein [Thermoplasmata archaeon]
MAVGVVIAVTPSGRVTLRATDARVAPEGTELIAPGGFAGTIVRVFGPVDRPFYSVRPRRAPHLEEATRWIGATAVRQG